VLYKRAVTFVVKEEVVQVCGDVQSELLWQQRPEARSGHPEHPAWVCKEALSRGFSNALLAAPLRRSVANSSPVGCVEQAALAPAAASFPFLHGMSRADLERVR